MRSHTDENLRLIRAIESAHLEAERRRIMKRALAEATPLERFEGAAAQDRYRHRDVMRALPIMAKGVGRTARGTDPLGATPYKEKRR